MKKITATTLGAALTTTLLSCSPAPAPAQPLAALDQASVGTGGAVSAARAARTTRCTTGKGKMVAEHRRVWVPQGRSGYYKHTVWMTKKAKVRPKGGIATKFYSYVYTPHNLEPAGRTSSVEQVATGVYTFTTKASEPNPKVRAVWKARVPVSVQVRYASCTTPR